MTSPEELLRQVSIVVCTVDRREGLERCLDSVRPFQDAVGEVLVVDNGPHGATVADIARRHDARVTVAVRRGTGAARNAGIRSARGSLIAFLDDDTRATAGWLSTLVAPLTDPSIDGVLGGVRAERPDHPVQQAFEELLCSGLAKTPELLDAQAVADPFPLRTAMSGFTMNAVFRRDVFDRFGYFDERFGPGTRVRYGDDVELFFNVLRQGGRILVEPRAMVTHDWPTDWTAIDRTFFGSGCAHTAILTKYFLEEPSLRTEIVKYAASRFRPWARPRLARQPGPQTPRLPMLLGSLYGPIAFLLSGKA